MLSTGAFAVVAGAITYVGVYQILNNGKAGQNNHSMLLADACILLCVILQVTLYVSSLFIHDYTKFSLYFGIDFVLTISHAMLLPCTIWDVRWNLGGVKNNDVH